MPVIIGFDLGTSNSSAATTCHHNDYSLPAFDKLKEFYPEVDFERETALWWDPAKGSYYRTSNQNFKGQFLARSSPLEKPT